MCLFFIRSLALLLYFKLVIFYLGTVLLEVEPRTIIARQLIS